MSANATLTSKGRTTIPKQIRDRLGMKPGNRMTFTLTPDGIILLRVKRRSLMLLASTLRKRARRLIPVARLSR